MAQDPNDMSGVAAATAGESAGIKRARQRTLEGDAPPDANVLADAISKAMQRSSALPPQSLGDIVRCSVRAGYETVRQVNSDGSSRMVTSPKKVVFTGDETPDGKTYEVANGRPVRLKREAYERRRDMGHVIIAE
jgi:hypothetical protein